MKKRKYLALGIVLITSIALATGCGEMIGKDGSGGGSGNGATASADTAEAPQNTDDIVTTNQEVEKEDAGSEQQETEATVKESSTINIVILALDVYCDDQLLVGNLKDIEDDSIKDSVKDTIGNFLDDAKENQCNVRLNIHEADPRMQDIVIGALTERDIDFDIEGE